MVSEERLLASLTSLSRKKQLSFALLLFERMLPSLIAFSKATGRDDSCYDKRTFIIENTKLGSGPDAGRFDVRQINSSRTDFSSAIINLDFSKIKAMTRPSPSLIPDFKEYQGIIGRFDLELAEGFGHEGEHGVYALDHLAGAVKTQSVINDELEMLQIHNRGALVQDADMAKPYLDASELAAQRRERMVNEELNNPQE